MIAFEVINHEIDLLMKRLAAKKNLSVLRRTGIDVSRCLPATCEVAGTDETVALCIDIADTIDPDDNNVIPTSNTQH